MAGHALGPVLSRAIATPLYGEFSPPLGDQQSYVDDTDEFRHTLFHTQASHMLDPIISWLVSNSSHSTPVCAHSQLVAGAFAGTLALFICLMPDGKLHAQAGMAATQRRDFARVKPSQPLAFPLVSLETSFCVLLAGTLGFSTSL